MTYPVVPDPDVEATFRKLAKKDPARALTSFSWFFKYPSLIISANAMSPGLIGAGAGGCILSCTGI